MALTLEQARQLALNRQQTYSPQIAPKEEAKPKKKNNGGFFGAIGYGLEKLGLGLLRGVEGVVDFTVGGIADLVGADDLADSMMKNDWVNYNHADEWYNPDGFMGFVGDVAGGVGQMLPSVAITVASNGTLAPVATGMFITSAAGQSVSDAAKTTGELGAKEWIYGGASGAIEGAIEKVSGGIGGTQAGTLLGKQIAKSTLGKVGASFVGEGLEEVASDLIDPSLRRVTGVDPNAKVDVSQLPNTFLVGGTAGAVLGGGSRAISAAKAGGYNNLNAQEDLATIREAQSKGNSLQADGKLSEKWEKHLCWCG